MQEQRTIQATAKLSEAKDALQSGDRGRAHELSVQATGLAPRDIDVLLFRAATTDDLKERLDCLSQVLSLRPDNKTAQRGLYETLEHLLEQNAFLGYVDETNRIYHVRTGIGNQVTVPKLRDTPPPFPASQPQRLARASRFFALALLGLPAAGLLTLVTAPLAIGYALSANERSVLHADRVRAHSISIIGLLLWLASMVLAALFVIHLAG